MLLYLLLFVFSLEQPMSNTSQFSNHQNRPVNTTVQYNTFSSISRRSFAVIASNNWKASNSIRLVEENAPGRTQTCPMCNGTGYINDNGNGELVTATWWRLTTGNSGDGTFCDGVGAYHDPCDADWSETGGTYHHDYKRTCPMCNGSGTVSSRTSLSSWTSKNGWTSWYGTSWSHAYSDDDGDGHCDEHYWHVPLEFDVKSIIFLLLILSIYVSFKSKREAI